MKVIFRLMLLGGITIIVITFYKRIYCHDHTSLSTQIFNKYSLNITIFEIDYNIQLKIIRKMFGFHVIRGFLKNYLKFNI
jgi:hypothetical protein